MREQVMRAGLRRRRFAFAGAGSVAAVAAVAAAGLFAGTTAGSDSLRINQPAAGSTSPSPAAATAAGPRGNDMTSRAGVGETTQPGASTGSQPAPQAAPAPAPPSRASAAPSSGHGRHQPVTRTEREFGQVCQGDQMKVGSGGVSTSGWCVSVAPPGARDSSPLASLTVTVCRSTTKDAGALIFDTAQEVDFVISSPSSRNALWRWSTGQRFRSTRHVLYLGYSQCVDWETTWDWRDDRGAPVPSGRALRLTAWSTSHELSNHPVAVDFSA
jgi:hypothetical protein